MSETELKFDLPLQAGPEFRKLARLAAADPSRARLLALYFDTPGCELAKHGMALRLRRRRVFRLRTRLRPWSLPALLVALLAIGAATASNYIGYATDASVAATYTTSSSPASTNWRTRSSPRP